jgi:crotonobetainyl-CoA:carnitine CoA-transferase CaiB-like acyl-CoA transferase
MRLHAAAGRNANRLEILEVVRPWVAARPVAEILKLLDGIDLPCAKVQRIDEVLADPQIQARGMVVEQDHPVLGRIRLPNLPFRMSGCDTSITQVAPDLGEHNAEITASLGFDAAQIADMQADGVLFSA